MNKTFYSPLPCFYKGRMISGFLFDWPKKCRECSSLACKSFRVNELTSCSHGFDSFKLREDLIFSGFFVKEFSQKNKLRSKNFSTYNNNVILKNQLDSIVRKINLSIISLNEIIENEKKESIEKYLVSEEYKKEFFKKMSLEIKKGLSFVHDYKQINSQIAQNINVIIESKYTGITLDEKLSKSSHEEKAIYYSSKFLQEKLNVAKYLMHPEWINRQTNKVKSRFHGCLTKYIKIYKNIFNSKNIILEISGESHEDVFADPEILGVIPHTFLDNAFKYSKNNSTVIIFVEDQDSGILFSVTSYGPRINPDEMTKIFLPFVRGKEAEKMQEEGSGYGLFIAQEISKSLGTGIKVEQEKSSSAFGYKTIFSILIPYGYE